MDAEGMKDGPLADLVGISRVQILRLRRGDNNPSLKTAHKLALITNIPAETFVMREKAAA